MKKRKTDKAIFVCASKIKPRIMKFLWPGRVPYGCVTMFYGLAEKGKSTLCLDIAARISKGTTWPNSSEKAPKGSTLLIAQEDSWKDVGHWRYTSMKGDLKKIYLFRGIRRVNEEQLELLDISEDLPLIEEKVKKIKDLRLIVFDPINAYIGVDVYNNAQVRRALAPLAVLAQKYKLAVVLIHHVNKNIGMNILHRATGSTAFGEFVRQAHYFDSDTKNTERKLMLSAKKSYGKPVAGLAFRVQGLSRLNVNRIRLKYEPKLIYESADDLFGQNLEDRTKTEKAMEWLREELSEGKKLFSALEKEVKKQNFSMRTLHEAKKRLGIKSIAVRNKQGVVKTWAWELP